MLKSSFHILVALLLLMALTSCSLERRLAREYVKDHSSEAVMLLPADYIFKENPGATIDPAEFPDPTVQDSVAIHSSLFVQYVSDSIFLTLFTNALIDELTAYGYNVILDQAADEFLSTENPSWIVQIAQLLIEEDYSPEFVYGYDDEDEEYIQEYQTNTITLNSWVEVSPINKGRGKRQLLFLSGYISDEEAPLVTMDYYNGEFYINDFRNRVELSDLYRMASASGRKHAELLSDYFMNDFIRRNLVLGSGQRKEMHYNRRLNRISEGLFERFEVIP